MHGVQAIANAIPATSGPPLPARSISASTCHSRFRRATNRLATKRTPMAMISDPGDLLQRVAVVLERLADPGRGQARGG